MKHYTSWNEFIKKNGGKHIEDLVVGCLSETNCQTSVLDIVDYIFERCDINRSDIYVNLKCFVSDMASRGIVDFGVYPNVYVAK